MSKDRCIGILFLLIFAALWFWLIPSYTRGPTEAAYPRFAAFLMLVPAFVMIFRKAAPKDIIHLPAFDLKKLLQSPFVRTVLLVLSYMVYLNCVEAIGFYVSGFVFCVFWMLFFGERSILRITLTPFFILGSMYVLITKVLRYPLPAGLLF
jgi:Na+-translocating ferredoxin:NAD+ oxidoreductase RnfA subunit